MSVLEPVRYRGVYVCAERGTVAACELPPGEPKPKAATIRVRCSCGQTHAKVKPLAWRRATDADSPPNAKIVPTKRTTRAE